MIAAAMATMKNRANRRRAKELRVEVREWGWDVPASEKMRDYVKLRGMVGIGRGSAEEELRAGRATRCPCYIADRRRGSRLLGQQWWCWLGRRR
jgi:hypothetical protein